MDDPPLSAVRNFGIIAHIDAGKTTTTERILYYSGIEHRLGNVDEGTTRTDFDAEEQERGITIYSAAVSTKWTVDEREYRLNLIDTPGHVDFTAEVERSLRVLDGAVGIFCARGGVEAQSETVWHQADRYQVPRLAFVNKMDRAGADFEAVLAQMIERLHAKPVPVQIPLGRENDFEGVIDLITMRWLWFDEAELGRVFEAREIPPRALAAARKARETMLDRLCDFADEDFIAQCLDGTAGAEAIHRQLRRGTLARAITPVLCGASLRNKGVQPLLDAICRYLPSPTDVEGIRGLDPKTERPVLVEVDPQGPAAALAFKCVAETHGDATFLRVYSGVLQRGKAYYNPRTRTRERLTHLFRVYADSRTSIEALPAGDIGVAMGLKQAVTGDTLCDEKRIVALESLSFPEPVVSIRIEPNSSADRDKLLKVLDRLTRQDPTFRWKHDEETGELLISGMGELHLEVLCHRLARDFKVEVKAGKPSVAYKETFVAPLELEETFERPIAGKVQYAAVRIRVEPWPHADAPVVALAPDLTREELPLGFQEAAREGLKGAVMGGGRFGFALLHVKATLLGGRARSGDSSEQAFEAAAGHAFARAVQEGRLALLWPVMRFEVRTPEEFMGAITGDLNARRAIIEAMGALGPLRVVRGVVPIAEMFGYAGAVRGLSQGRASFSLEFSHCDRVPPEITRKFEV